MQIADIHESVRLPQSQHPFNLEKYELASYMHRRCIIIFFSSFRFAFDTFSYYFGFCCCFCCMYCLLAMFFTCTHEHMHRSYAEITYAMANVCKQQTGNRIGSHSACVILSSSSFLRACLFFSLHVVCNVCMRYA